MRGLFCLPCFLFALFHCFAEKMACLNTTTMTPLRCYENQQVTFDGVVKTSIYCVVCPVAILNILHV